MYRFLTLALATSVLALPAFAADRKLDADACAKAVAPYLDDRTVAVLHVDLTSVDVNAVAAKIADLAKVDADSLPFLRKEWATSVKSLNEAGAHDLFVVFSLADVPERQPFLVIPATKEVNEEAVRAAGAPLWFLFHNGGRIGDAFVAADDQATLKRLRDLKPPAFPELAKAFAAAGGTAQLAIVPPKDAGKIIETVMPTLPAEVGGGSSKVLTQGFRWAAVGLDAPKLKLSLTVQTADADAAKGLLDLLKKAYAAVGKSKEVREAFPDFDKLADLFTPKTADDTLTLVLDDEVLTTVLRPLVAKAGEASERSESTQHLKQLAIAAHNYLSTYNVFPAACSTDKKGAALLSWRVHLLPYLAEDKLYKEFHLDEPWDSDHNKKLIARMPAVFRSTADAKLAAAGKTTYLAPVGDATMFPVGRGVRIAEVTDGTSNTILFVQANDDLAVEWTKPDDLVYDPKTPSKGLGSRFPGGFLAVFADGATHFISNSITKDTLRALFTRNGGEVPGSDFR